MAAGQLYDNEPLPLGKLELSVLNANASFSIANKPAQPARFNPRLRPPQPAKASTKYGGLWFSTIAFQPLCLSRLVVPRFRNHFMAKSNKKHQATIGARVAAAQVIRKLSKSRLDAAAPREEGITPARSRIMRSIRQKHTKPEVLVRKLIHGMGLRFRLHRRDLPGKPDIVMRRHGVIVQVHGCFWHQHGCSISNIPRTRKEYWIPKLARNAERDKANDSLLTSMGWRVITVWECELKDPPTIAKRLRKLILARSRAQ